MSKLYAFDMNRAQRTSLSSSEFESLDLTDHSEHSNSEGCLLDTANTVIPRPLPQEAPAETRRGGGGGGGGGGGMSSNIANPNASRARGNSGTNVVAEGGGGGGGGSGEGYAGGGRKENSTTTIKNPLQSQSSLGTIVGAAGGVGGSKMNIDGGELVEEELESPMDAR